MNEVLKNNEGKILNPKIPRYETLIDYILENNSNEIIINNLNIAPNTPIEILIDGSTNPFSESPVNIGCYPNDKNTFSVARVTGIENNAGNINSLYNTNINNLYLGRVVLGNHFMVKSFISWGGAYLKNLSLYNTPSLNNIFVFGEMGSMINLSDSTITSLKIVIASGEFVAGTRVKICKS